MNFSDMTSNGNDILDWRHPALKFRFDLMESEWTDSIELNLSMTPGFKARNTPISVKFNDADPVVLKPKGNAFDARIRLNSKHIQTNGNIISITAQKSSTHDCLSVDNGAWTLNHSNSFVTIHSRTKARHIQIGEIEKRLKHPTTSPKTVAIQAVGLEKAKLEMLAAQGTALRMAKVPNFHTRLGSADMEIILARRDQLRRYVTDEDILNDTGAKISVHVGRPLRLVLTGDSDEELMRAAKEYATHHMPRTRRIYTTPVELSSQRSFTSNRTVIDNKQKLSDLNFGLNLNTWSSAPEVLHFDVKDPSTQNGEIVLYFNVGEEISSDSRVYVELNDKSIGYAALDKEKKSVAFDIPAHLLKGAGNTLKVTPDLIAVADSMAANGCVAANSDPGLSLRSKSYISLTPALESPHSELSRLTSGSDPFSFNRGQYTHVILAHKTGSDLNASLRVLAKLAQAKGAGWTEAFVSYDDQATLRPFKFIVGPKTSTAKLLHNAPKSLEAALRGQKLVQTNTLPRGSFASSDADATMQIYANWVKDTKAQNKGLPQNVNGGIAAMYQADNQFIGVITAASGKSFSAVSSQLLNEDIWHRLSGSVARWDRKSMVMAQTASPIYLSQLGSVKTKNKTYKTKSDKQDGIFAFGHNMSNQFTDWRVNRAEENRARKNQRDIARAQKRAQKQVERQNNAKDKQAKRDTRAQKAMQKQEESYISAPITASAPAITPARSAAPMTTPPEQRAPDLTMKSAAPDNYVRPTLRSFSRTPTPTRTVKTADLRQQTLRKTRAAGTEIKKAGHNVKAHFARLNSNIEQRLTQRRVQAPRMPRTDYGRTLDTQMKALQSQIAPAGAKIKSLAGLTPQNGTRAMPLHNSRMSQNGLFLIFAVIFMALILGLMKPSAKDTKHY